MIKNIILLGTLMLSSLAYSQVGINNEAPKATLDVTAKTTGITTPEGIIAPRLSGNDIKGKDAQYLADQKGAIVYATAPVGTASTKTANITAEGYYYFDGSVWTKFGSGTAASTPEPWYIQNTITPASANTQNIYQQGKVAVGFSDTDAISGKQFEVKGDVKAIVNNAGIYSILETNNTDFGIPANIMFSSDNPNLIAATRAAIVSTSINEAALSAQGANGNSSVGATINPSVGSKAEMSVGNSTTNILNKIVVGSNGETEQVDKIILRSENTPASTATRVLVDKTEGVTFKYGLIGNPSGNYTFPQNNGTAGQVLVTNGAASTLMTGAQLSWQNVSNLVPNDDWKLLGNAGTTPIGTVPTAVGTTNYVGTSDAQNFVVGVNGISRGIFTQQGSFIGGAGTMDLGALPAHTFGATPPTGSFIWGGGHQLAVSAGNANYAAVYGNRNSVSSSNGFTTGTSNTIGTGSVASMVSGNQNNLGNNFQASIVTGRSNTMNYTATGGNGNVIAGESNNLSGTAAPKGAIVGGYLNTITAAGNGFLLTGTGNTISGTMPNAAVVGTYNTAVDNSLFTVGNGTAAASQSNAMVVFANGSVAVNASSIPSFTSNSATINPKLHVAGDVASTGAFYTNASKYADYVFEDYYDGSSKINADYDFKSLAETAAYIKANKHLPGVTAIKDILKTKDGYTVNLSELSIQQLEKIEELYLHTIEQQEEISSLKSRMEKLEQLLLKTSNNK